MFDYFTMLSLEVDSLRGVGVRSSAVGASPQVGRSSDEGASLHMARVWAFRFN